MLDKIIKESVFGEFNRSGEPFLFYEGFFYSLEPTLKPDSNYFFSYLGNFYNLISTEEISSLEETNFMKHKDIMETRISNIIKNDFENEFKNLKDREGELFNLFERSKSFSIERFFVEEIVPTFEKLYDVDFEVGEMREIDIQKTSDKAPEIELPSIDDVIKGFYVMKEYISKKNLFFINDEVYEIVVGTDESVWLNLRDIRHSLSHFCSIDGFFEGYTRALNKKLDKVVRKNSQKYVDAIGELQAKVKQLSIATKDKNVWNKNNYEFKVRDSSIGLRKESNNRYFVYLKLDPYVVQRNQHLYSFEDNITFGSLLLEFQ
jgi:hypothetical protein